MHCCLLLCLRDLGVYRVSLIACGVCVVCLFYIICVRENPTTTRESQTTNRTFREPSEFYVFPSGTDPGWENNPSGTGPRRGPTSYERVPGVRVRVRVIEIVIVMYIVQYSVV